MRQIAMLLMVLGLAVVAAPGGVVWEEDFDNYTSWPDGGWTVSNNADLSSGFDHSGSGNSLVLVKSWMNEIYGYHGFDSQAKGAVTGWVYQTNESTPGDKGGLRFTIVDSVNDKDIGYICLTEDKYVTLNTPNGYDVAKRLGTYDANTWYQVSLSWDASTHQVTASFNGGTPLTLPYAQSGAENGDQFWAYNCNDRTTEFNSYVDDIVVTPEPATMGLLACGLIGLLRRRS